VEEALPLHTAVTAVWRLRRRSFELEQKRALRSGSLYARGPQTPPGRGVDRPGARQDLASYDEVFISSTSRWVLPVSEVVLPDKTRFVPASTSLTEALYRDLLGHVTENSTPL
jgi:hypothetical protein